MHCAINFAHIISSSVSSQGYIRHWLIHPRRWCQGPPHTDQESHQVCIDPSSKHNWLNALPHTVLSSAKSLQSTAWCVGALPSSAFSRTLFLFLLIIVSQIIGIVYSAKLVPIEENLLYTKENHFTGSLSILSLRVCTCIHDHSCQVTRSSGVD